VEDCEECTTTFSFYVISGSDLSHSPHGGRDFWSHFEASQMKEDATAYESEDTSDRRCAGHNMSPSSDRRMTTSGDTSDRRCEGHNMSPSSDRPMTTGEDTLEKV